MTKQFVHLHLHTEYSMLDGLNIINPRHKHHKLIDKAVELGMPALAITDHGGMYGCLHFYNACKKAGIKPIIGVEIYMARNSRFDKQTKMGADQTHLTLLAKNEQGYKNLMKLTSLANLEGFSYKPRIDKELLFDNAEGIIVFSGCPSSHFNRLLRTGKDDEALDLFKEFKEKFGDDFYIEIQRHPQIDFLEELNKKLVKISRDLDIKLVATGDVHYLTKDDAPAQDALICVGTRRLISDEKRMKMSSPDYYLKTAEEMSELFHDLPEAVENTLEIAEKCNVHIKTGQLIFPKYDIPEGETIDTYFTKYSQQKLKEKFSEVTKVMEDRLRYEIDIIINKGYSAYFLITQDFVNWAKAEGIAVGPGRGSAAGSLVSYCLGITSINPLEHNLPFERFLNPERPTPPDIDLDFADVRRDEVIKYCSRKYGDEQVAHVITFGRMESRVSIRDIGRVLGMPYEEPDTISKLIPSDPGKKTSLSQALDQVPELAEYYKQPKYKHLIDLAQRVEGVVRHSSVHAAAVIIADQALHNYTPIQKDSKSGKMVTQYDMYALDCNVDDNAIGLLKFDFLGLRTLTTIQFCTELIQQTKGIKVNLDDLTLDDKKTYELLSQGETMGVFQLESSGMRRVSKSLKPTQFSDVSALLALYRPGPMELIPQFIEGKHNPEGIVYLHPNLKQVFEETYGVMVYQEQVMEIFSLMAGYSLGEADMIRRAMGKKKISILDENKKRFVLESGKRGYSKDVAEKVWQYIMAFANYGFNKAHAASYAMISYQTAYLKANYPVEYMAALMSVEANSHSMNAEEKVSAAIEVSKKMGIKILTPNINRSGNDFVIEKDEDSLEGLAIRFGFSAVKNVGTAAVENILETQKVHGEFVSFTEFINKTDGRKVNKKVLESLIKVGAMDQYGTRASMLENLDSIRQTAKQYESEVEGQDNLFGGVEETVGALQDTFAQLPEYPKQELLSFEKELLGMYLTEHPMARSLQSVSKKANKKIGDLDADIHQDQTFTIGGILVRFRQVVTKKSGKPMAFGTIQDDSGKLEFVVFPKTYEEYGKLLEENSVLLFKGKIDVREGEMQLMVDKITSPSDFNLNHIASGTHEEIYVPRKTAKETLNKLGELLKANPGDQSVIVLIPNGGQPKKVQLPYGVNWSKKLEQDVKELLN
ncbi:MAG: DNA polymerase III subunit alpha [Candidatus Pacebacteria bacterium]|nr:DNA polymerase III subunit alpha [Candidatus Paceibacterota bacterium]